MTYGERLLLPSLIEAGGIAVTEYFFHKYVSRSVLEVGEKYNNGNYRYKTEASEELYPVKPDVRSDEDTGK